MLIDCRERRSGRGSALCTQRAGDDQQRTRHYPAPSVPGQHIPAVPVSSLFFTPAGHSLRKPKPVSFSISETLVGNGAGEPIWRSGSQDFLSYFIQDKGMV